MVIREYLVENFGFDDSLLKTLGMGKQANSNPDAKEGSIQVLVFPVGTVIPADKPLSVTSSNTAGAPRPVNVLSTQKP